MRLALGSSSQGCGGAASSFTSRMGSTGGRGDGRRSAARRTSGRQRPWPTANAKRSTARQRPQHHPSESRAPWFNFERCGRNASAFSRG